MRISVVFVGLPAHSLCVSIHLQMNISVGMLTFLCTSSVHCRAFNTCPHSYLYPSPCADAVLSRDQQVLAGRCPWTATIMPQSPTRLLLTTLWYRCMNSCICISSYAWVHVLPCARILRPSKPPSGTCVCAAHIHRPTCTLAKALHSSIYTFLCMCVHVCA